MRRRLFLTAAALTAAALAPVPTRAEPGLMGVVASFSILADLLRQIGGERVVVTAIVPPGADAHGYQPRPADARAVAGARLVAMNGLGFDPWMQRLAQAAGFKGVTVVASVGTTPRTVTRGQGAASIDPHAWQDPRNGARYANALAEGLAAADPAAAGAYRTAGARLAADILRLDDWIEAQYAEVPPVRRRIITTHDAFGYHGARYGIEFLAAQGLSTESEPSAKAIAALVAQIKREKIRAVFLEKMTDPRLAQMLMRETGAVLGGAVYSDALSDERGPASTYTAMLRHNTTLFAASMRG